MAIFKSQKRQFLKVKSKYLFKVLGHKTHPHESPRQELASPVEIPILGRCPMIASPLNCFCL
jgi:hypothetical protein